LSLTPPAIRIRRRSRLQAFAKPAGTSREWLAATAASSHPDFVPQIVELFDSPRARSRDLCVAEGVFAGHDRGEHGYCVPKTC
jgi:hypothetical protein